MFMKWIVALPLKRVVADKPGGSQYRNQLVLQALNLQASVQTPIPVTT